MARRGPTAAGLALLGAGLLAGGAAVGWCTGPRAVPEPRAERTVPSVIDESRASAEAPATFRSRRALPSCGDVVRGQGDRIPQPALDCLRAGGELAVASLTIEGDPVVLFLRTGRGIRGTEVFADGTRDRFGPGDWSRTRCPTRGVTPHGGCA